MFRSYADHRDPHSFPTRRSSDLRTIALTKSDDKNWTANFTFQRPAENQLILDGRMDNHQVHLELQLTGRNSFPRSEEHTSELQSLTNLVCRLLLEKKNKLTM